MFDWYVWVCVNTCMQSWERNKGKAAYDGRFDYSIYSVLFYICRLCRNCELVMTYFKHWSKVQIYVCAHIWEFTHQSVSDVNMLPDVNLLPCNIFPVTSKLSHSSEYRDTVAITQSQVLCFSYAPYITLPCDTFAVCHAGHASNLLTHPCGNDTWRNL